MEFQLLENTTQCIVRLITLENFFPNSGTGRVVPNTAILILDQLGRSNHRSRVKENIQQIYLNNEVI